MKVGTPQNGKSQIRPFTKTVINSALAKHFSKVLLPGESAFISLQNDFNIALFGQIVQVLRPSF
jgi:hypothetical protein